MQGKEGTLGAELRVRDGTVDDVDIIVRHRRLMFEEMGFTDSDLNDKMDSHVRDQLLEDLPSGSYRGWLVEDSSGAVIAGAGLSVVRLLGKPINPAGAYAYLMNMYVDPVFRRRGIARSLMRMMIDWSGREGLGEVKLHAADAGRPLYEQLGFKQTNEMRLLLEE